MPEGCREEKKRKEGSRQKKKEWEIDSEQNCKKFKKREIKKEGSQIIEKGERATKQKL